MLDRIRPNDVVPITYAGDRTFEVKVLGLLSYRKLIGVMKKLKTTDDPEERIDCVIKAVTTLAAKEVTDDWIDSLSILDANEIMEKAIQVTQVSEDERKKSE